MDATVIAAIIGAASVVVSAIAGGIISKTGRTPLEREIDLYVKASSMNAFSQSALDKLKTTIEDRMQGKWRERRLEAAIITFAIYIIFLGIAMAILSSFALFLESQWETLTIILLITLVTLMLSLVAFQGVSVHQSIFTILENRERKKREAAEQENRKEGQETASFAKAK